MEVSSLKDLNQKLNTQLAAAQDSLGQEEVDGASSMTSQVSIKPCLSSQHLL